MRIKSAVLEDKDEASINPTVPSQLEEGFEELYNGIVESLQSKQSDAIPPPYEPEAAVIFFATTSRRIGPWFVASSIHRNLSRGMHAIPIEEEVTECFQTLQGPLHREATPLLVLITCLRAPQETQPRVLPLHQHQHIPLIYGPLHPRERRL